MRGRRTTILTAAHSRLPLKAQRRTPAEPESDGERRHDAAGKNEKRHCSTHDRARGLQQEWQAAGSGQEERGSVPEERHERQEREASGSGEAGGSSGSRREGQAAHSSHA